MPEYLRQVAGSSDLYYVDLDMFDVDAFGAAYIIDADRPAIVETGVGRRVGRILDSLRALDIEPVDVEVVATTHVHLDHAGGVGYLLDECPNATAITHDSGTGHLVDIEALVAGTKRAVGEQWQYYADPKPAPANRVEGVEDGDIIDLGDHPLSVHHVPGHAHHQAVFRDETTGAVFTGDAAGIYIQQRDRVVETTPPPEFDLEQALADVETIRRLDPEVLLYTHFGERTDVDAALAEYERVLPGWVEEVRQCRDEMGSDEEVMDHFAAQADTVDVWGEHKARPEARLNTRGVLQYLDR